MRTPVIDGGPSTTNSLVVGSKYSIPEGGICIDLGMNEWHHLDAPCHSLTIQKLRIMCLQSILRQNGKSTTSIYARKLFIADFDKYPSLTMTPTLYVSLSLCSQETPPLRRPLPQIDRLARREFGDMGTSRLPPRFGARY